MYTTIVLVVRLLMMQLQVKNYLSDKESQTLDVINFLFEFVIRLPISQ